MREKLFIVGRGIGQVMFQNNAFSGLLMFIGLLCNSWQMALLAVAGNVVSNALAYGWPCDREAIKDGLYGFNGTLVGLALGALMLPDVGLLLVFSFLLVGSLLSVGFVRLFRYWGKLPGYTAPFILSVWLLLAANHLLFPDNALPHAFLSEPEQQADLFRAFSFNLGQVMFQGKAVLSGLFFLAAIFVNSRRDAFYTVWGALLPLATVLLPGIGITDFNAGMIGYNGVLCAIALGGDSWKSFCWATVSVLLSIALQLGGMHAGIVTLTAPFVLSVWIVLLIRRWIEKC